MQDATDYSIKRDKKDEKAHFDAKKDGFPLRQRKLFVNLRTITNNIKLFALII